MIWRVKKATLIANAVINANRRLQELAAMQGTSPLPKLVLEGIFTKMLSDINAIRAGSWPMEQLHGRSIAVVEVLDECLTTADAELLVCDKIHPDATVARRAPAIIIVSPSIC